MFIFKKINILFFLSSALFFSQFSYSQDVDEVFELSQATTIILRGTYGNYIAPGWYWKLVNMGPFGYRSDLTNGTDVAGMGFPSCLFVPAPGYSVEGPNCVNMKVTKN